MKVHLKFSKTKTNRVKPLVLCLAIAGMAVGTYQPVFADESPIATIVNQQKTISGKVVDENGEPIIGANIVVKGTTIGIITDINGEFTLQVPSDQSILEISYIGYKSAEISVKGQKSLDIRLMSDTENLDEVIVVGYGTQKKVNLTGAVQNVSSEDLTKRSLPNASVALQGLIPGVSAIQGSGKPGADGATIKIRGTGSINTSTTPLILIDGIEGDMNNIDMNTIESISVLKDAASASIYGSRASNGVILITTKRAKDKGLKISYNGWVGVNTPTSMPDPVDAIGYMEAINVARANANMEPQYDATLIEKYRKEGADNFNYFDTDWRNLVLKNSALTHNHSVSVSGGGERFNVFANGSYFYQDGIIANNDYSRMTLRVNTDFKVTDWLKAGVDINIRQGKNVVPANDTPEGIIGKAITFSPVFSGLNNDGTYGLGQNGDNPLANSEASGVKTQNTPELGVRGYLEINPMKGLNAYVGYSSRKVETKTDYFLSPYDTYEGGEFKQSYPTTGNKKSEAWDQSIYNQFNAQVSYENTFAKNYFKVLAGIQTEEINNHSTEGIRQGFNYDGYTELDHGDKTTAEANGNRTSWAMLSYLARINYSFADRYLLELNGRWDASSRFMKGNRWGFFPSASIGWRISEEAFFEPVKQTIENLKIRASYGTLGNQAITEGGVAKYYPYASELATKDANGSMGYWFDKTAGNGVAQTQVANEKISWEKSTQANFGLDASALNSRLSLSFDYYIRNITDMLQKFPIPYYVGLSSAWQNAGSMRNNGWDLTLTWRDRIGKVNYHATGVLSDVRNKITNLYGNEYIEETYTTREGYPLMSWYGYVSDGYFQSQTEIDNPDQPVYGGNKQNVKPGYIKYKDISGPKGKPDGVIDDHDRTIIGDPTPRYEFSLNLGAEWNNFDFSVFLQGVGKRDILYTGSGARPFYVGRSIFEHQLDYWTPDNRNAEFPILLIEGSKGGNMNNIVSDFWVKSGAYMRVKNIVVGYTLPKKVINKMKIDNLRFYVSGQNLLTICNAYKGYDPENTLNGGSFYPLMQTFTFGLDIRF